MDRTRFVLSACLALAVVASCNNNGNGPDTDGGGTGMDAPNPGVDSGMQTSGGGSVVTLHNSPTRDGMFTAPTLTRAAAASMMVDPGFSASITGPTYASPLYFDAGAGGTSLVIVATEHNDVFALDANTGHQVWMHNIGTPSPGANAAGSPLPCGNIDPVLGITGTPAIDVASRTVFVDGMTYDGSNIVHMVHALSLDDGSERSGGWPVNADMAIGHGFDSSVQNQRGGLLVVNGTLYVPYGGHWGDCGNYHGVVLGISIANPTMITSWLTRVVGGGAWAPGGVASDGTNIFVTTGNNVPLGNTTSMWQDQNAIIRLTAGLSYSATATDYFSPSSWQALDMADADLGGTGPLLIHVPGATPSDLVVALGKDDYAYLMDRGNLGGIGGQISRVRATSHEIITVPSAYPSMGGGVNVVLAGRCPTGGDLVALHVSAASPPVISSAWCATEGGAGAPIVTTTDGTAESVVWTIGDSSNSLRGFNGDTGAMISSTAVSDSFHRFISPIYANGRFYVAGATGVHAIVAH